MTIHTCKKCTYKTKHIANMKKAAKSYGSLAKMIDEIIP